MRKIEDKELLLNFSRVVNLAMLGAMVVNLPNCNDCGIKQECKYVPTWGDTVRYNCPHWKEGKDT